MKLLPLLAFACSDDPLTRLRGDLEVTAINAAPEARRVGVRLERLDLFAEGGAPTDRPATVVLLEDLDPGTWGARVDARDSAGVPLQVVWVDGVEVVAQRVNELLVDLGESPIPPPVLCEEAALCTTCENGREIATADDDRCGVIPCDGLDRFELRVEGIETTCIGITHAIGDRCAAKERCAEPNGAACVATELVLATAGICRSLSEASCAAGAPIVETVPDGTPCDTNRICRAGDCVPLDPPDPEIGCADGEREGFLSLDSHPSIAGCSGAWSIPGVMGNLAPGCARGAGDDGSNATGQGCSSLDLCAIGWHVCEGKDEVASRSSDGCAGAVPPGTREKSLFFAVRQSSENGSVCSSGAGDNDVFGCGNLGNALPSDKGCGVLDRVLASTQPNSCGFNEAEPPLGPWECDGPGDGHLHEGTLVTKKACASADCSYDGSPIGSWDKGGVLCCRD
jgi:hypothetical protein